MRREVEAAGERERESQREREREKSKTEAVWRQARGEMEAGTPKLLALLVFYWYKSTNNDTQRRRYGGRRGARWRQVPILNPIYLLYWYPIYLLYWCFTGTKLQIITHRRLEAEWRAWLKKTREFACFTGTKVQILTQRWRQTGGRRSRKCAVYTQFTCLPGTKVQILTQKFFKNFLPLLDAELRASLEKMRGEFEGDREAVRAGLQRAGTPNLRLALLVQKCKY